MNLVVDCMQVFTGKPVPYFKEKQKTLILSLFRESLENPSLNGHRKELRRIYEHLQEKNEALGIWKDCEPYYPINFLTRPREAQNIPFWVEMLKILTGMKDIRSSAAKLPDGYYRLNHLKDAVFEVRGGKTKKAPSNIIWRIEGFKPAIFLPRNGLFTDILDKSLYPDMRKPLSEAWIKRRVSRAVDHMREFSRDVWEDFQEAIFNVVLLTSDGSPGISSMSMRCKYFGAVFLNAFMNDEYKAVESLVHEYTHERCSLWWKIQEPTGIPNEKVQIISPVTGNRVRADFMIQAFIIYVSALQFYRYVQSTRMPSDRSQSIRLNRRAGHISRHLPTLHRRLRKTVRKGTDIDRLLDYLLEVYEPLSERP